MGGEKKILSLNSGKKLEKGVKDIQKEEINTQRTLVKGEDEVTRRIEFKNGISKFPRYSFKKTNPSIQRER